MRFGFFAVRVEGDVRNGRTGKSISDYLEEIDKLIEKVDTVEGEEGMEKIEVRIKELWGEIAAFRGN